MWQLEQSARKGGNVCIFDPTDWTGQGRTNWTVNIMKYERGAGGGGGDTSHWIHQTEERRQLHILESWKLSIKSNPLKG